jgi:hypothetical protein
METPDIRKTLEDSPWHSCEKGSTLFEPARMYKRISPLLSPTGKEEFAAAEVILCKQCGKIPPFFAELMGNCPAELVSECKK